MVKGLVTAIAMTCGYGGFVALLVWWMRSRLYKRALAGAETLKSAGAVIRSTHRSKGFRKPAEVEFELDGQAARYQVRQYSRDYIVQSIRLAGKPLPAILVRGERALDRLGKSLGLNREVQLGDPSFDDAAYIESAASDEVVRRALQPAPLRAQVLDLLRAGYRLDMSADGLGASRIRGFYSAFEVTELPAVMRALEAIQAALPAFEPSETTAPAWQYRWIWLPFLTLVAGIAVFPLMPIVHPPMDDFDSIKILGLGLIAWLVVMVWLARVFRQRHDGLRSLLLTGLLLIFAVPPLFAFGVFALNSKLDHGEVTTHKVLVLSLGRRDHELYFASWRPGRARDKVGTSREVFRTLKVGDTVEIDTLPGALGWTWVPGVRLVERARDQ